MKIFRIFLVALSFGFSGAQIYAADSLQQIAKKSLEANIIQLKSGPYLAAGQYQFHTLWTRDFAWASRGLFVLGRSDVVRNQLEHLLANLRPDDGLVPKTMDSMPPQNRVFLTTMDLLRNGIPLFRPIVDAIEPYFVDENESEAIDSNLLVLLTASDYVRNTGDQAWWDIHREQLQKVFQHYTSFVDKDGLIRQPAHSDWQDSVAREGKTLFPNVLYAVVSERLAEDPSFEISREQIARLHQRIDQVFLDPVSGVYRSLETGSWVSLDGNLLALDLEYIRDPEQRTALYTSLKSHPVFKGGANLPGSNTYPDYPSDWVSRAPWMSGLSHYHDRVYWSWLMALAGKTALTMGDPETSEKIFAALSKVASRDKAIAEIYLDTPALRIWRSRLYRSEKPFSWGSAFVLDFLSARDDRAILPVEK